VVLLLTVVLQVYYDFDQFGWDDANFIIHPENWFMASRISRDGLWRVSYGEVSGLTREQYLERQPMKFEAMLPGNPKPDAYKITNISPYKIHQRCAEKLRIGRFVIAADAAHLCNPLYVVPPMVGLLLTRYTVEDLVSPEVWQMSKVCMTA